MARLVWRLRQTDKGILYQVYGNGNQKTNTNVSIKIPNDLNSQILTNNDCTNEKLSMCDMQKSSSISSSLKSVVDAVKAEPATTRKRETRKRSCVNYSNQDTTRVKSESQGYVQLSEEELTNGQQKKAKKSKNSTNNAIHLSKTSNPAMSFQPMLRLKEEALDYPEGEDEYAELLKDYFQMDVDIEKLYRYWSETDPHFCKVAADLEGIRILRQDPTENLLSFVCSSNNHISRIASMVEKLCVHYGELITVVDGEKYYSIPTFDSLSGHDVEAHLRQLGFGYRAKFISSIARSLTEQKAVGWLDSLRQCSYEEAKKELLSLMGVGPKVADCVCLMSLDKTGAVPVDTHVWQITVKHYMAQLKTAKSLTDKIYNEIGEFYRNLWGPYAGWAHSVLFTADLKQNKSETAAVKGTPEKKTKKSLKLTHT